MVLEYILIVAVVAHLIFDVAIAWMLHQQRRDRQFFLSLRGMRRHDTDVSE